MTNEEINFIAMSLFAICFIVWFAIVVDVLIAYLTKSKCKNCKHCDNGVLCDILDESVENLNIEGECGFYKKNN